MAPGGQENKVFKSEQGRNQKVSANLPDYYHILGLSCYEEDSEVIRTTVRQRTSYIRRTFSAEQPEACESLLEQMAEAECVLLNPDQKAAYDADLRSRQSRGGTSRMSSGVDKPHERSDSDEDTPVVVIATESPVQEKILSNIAEVRARGATVIAVATEEDTEIEQESQEVFFVPRTDWLLQPLLAVLPVQLLAYHIAVLKGLNVDQPRNLAKTVTVE